MAQPSAAAEILPVIDLLGGVVVRGVAGRRSEYRPVESSLCDSAAPAVVAAAFRSRFGFPDAYVADLDAIAGASAAVDDYARIAAAGLELWVDAGVNSVRRAQRLIDAAAADAPIARLVLGLESLPHPDVLFDIAEAVDPGRLVFSLDLRDGAPLAPSPAWPADPPDVAALAVECGLMRMIVLDLSRVGVDSGIGTHQLCRDIHRRWPSVELIAGGGVRNTTDLETLSECGVRRALVASALHDGRITPAALSAAQGGGS